MNKKKNKDINTVTVTRERELFSVPNHYTKLFKRSIPCRFLIGCQYGFSTIHLIYLISYCSSTELLTNELTFWLIIIKIC